MSVIITIGALAGSASTSQAEAQGDPFPLGDFQLLSTKPSCITGFSCRGFSVTACTNLQAGITGVIAKSYPPNSVTVRGMVVFFSGTAGMGWWNGGTGIGGTFFNDLRLANGLALIQVRWDAQWFQASLHEDAGVAHEGCRPATVIRWIYDNLYMPLDITPAPGACGFCITGNSGGASQVTYALSHYGLDGIVNAVIATSGPTMSRLDKGCLPDYPDYHFEAWSTPAIDRAFGWLDEVNDPGPCVRADPAQIQRWLEEGIVSGAMDLIYPSVRVEIVIGGADNTAAPFQAADYRDALLADPGNHVTWTFVPDMVHSIGQSQSGLNALEAALLESL